MPGFRVTQLGTQVRVERSAQTMESRPAPRADVVIDIMRREPSSGHWMTCRTQVWVVVCWTGRLAPTIPARTLQVGLMWASRRPNCTPVPSAWAWPWRQHCKSWRRGAGATVVRGANTATGVVTA